MIPAGSDAVVEWICPYGHEYAAAPDSRTGAKGSGCPVCANLSVLVGFNDLATSHPHIAEQWHPSLNGTVAPETVVAGSGKKFYWRCLAGHDYVAQVHSPTSGRGCPACAGRQVIAGFNDLRMTHPHVASEWDYEGNKNRTPESVIAGSNWTAHWICTLGHEYTKPINRRAAGSGCQYCSNSKVLRGFNDLETRYSELARDWHPEMNKPLAASDVLPGKRWWKCFAGHEKFGTVPNRIQAGGCAKCSPSRRALNIEN
ncbi:zinc-ribbon domain-containing protein [Arthrobacter sp. D3-16]